MRCHYPDTDRTAPPSYPTYAVYASPPSRRPLCLKFLLSLVLLHVLSLAALQTLKVNLHSEVSLLDTVPP